MSIFSNKILDRINGEEIAKLTLDLVNIHSVTGTEQVIQEFYAAYLKKAGLEVKMQQVDETGRSNVIGKIAGSGKGKNLMIHSHLDTIKWDDAIQPYYNRSENQVYGRGAADMKGQCALQAVAGKAIVESGVKLCGDLYIVGGAGEEGSPKKWDGSSWGYGAQVLVEQGFPVVDAAVVLECNPALGIAIGNHGSMRFEFNVVGADYQRHSVTVPLNLNPLFWQAEVVTALEKLNQEFAKRKHSLSGPSIITLGAITYPPHAGVPMSCKVSGAIRVNPSQTRESVIEDIESLAGELRKRCPLEIEMTVGGDPVYWEVSPDEPVVKSFQRAFKKVVGKDVLLGGHPANADSRWFNKGNTEWHMKHNPKGLTTIGFGPDHSSLHSNLEHMDIEQAVTAAKVIALAALDFCGTV